MTNIEAKALALVNEYRRAGGYRLAERMASTDQDDWYCAAKLALEREEATEARHAAELREQAERFSGVAARVHKYLNQFLSGQARELQEALAPFILPAPDPLKSWMHKSGYEGNSVVEQALADLAQNGGKIVWEAGE